MHPLPLQLPFEVPLGPDRWTAAFWAAALEHRLVAAQCAKCTHFRSPPTPYCPRCRSQEVTWVELPGGAELYTFTIVRHPPAPSLAALVPYVIGMVRLDGAEGVKFMTNVVNCLPEEVHIGMRLHVVWDDVSNELTVPRFAP